MLNDESFLHSTYQHRRKEKLERIMSKPTLIICARCTRIRGQGTCTGRILVWIRRILSSSIDNFRMPNMSSALSLVCVHLSSTWKGGAEIAQG